ncbi:MAG: DNA repair protein RecN, partial [Succiniclasticum sp.]
MLQSLQVHNFALIEDAQVEFTPGFNIFTGETGAGKSILIDAFGIVLGGRASTSFIRSGTEEFRIQAVFDTEGDPRVSSLLREQDIEEEDSLYLKRTLTAAGKSRSSINGMPVPLAVLKRVSRLLVDIHGQHENQSLLHPKMPLRLTDTFGGDEGQAARQQYDDAYDRYQEARQSLAELEEKGGQRERLMDRLQWEIQEIEEAAITPGEEERLRDEVKVLQHADKIRSALSEAYELLDRENGALDLLADSRGAIETAQRFDSSLQDIYEGLDSAWIAADDAKSRLRDYMESQDFDEARLGEVQDRLDLLYRLQKKYGAGEAAVLAYGQKAKGQYAELQDLDQRVAQARERCRRETDALKVAAAALTKVRQRTAKKLCEAVTVHMRDLAMPEGKFTIQFSEKPDFGEDGRDQMEFLFSANRGEPLKPLVQVASGGELS